MPAGTQALKVVAKLQVDLPAQNTFTLRGTLPIPKGTFPRPDGLLPFAIGSPDGSYFPAQLEIVSHYANANQDGADVVEILARVDKPAGQASGRAEYDVVEYVHPTRSLRTTDAINWLYSTPGTVVVESRDVFGNQYDLDLLHEFDGFRVMRDGRAASTYRLYSSLRPNGPVGPPSGALTHFMGVHSYVTVWSDEDVMSIDFRVSNGASGVDASSLSDPQLDLYFQSLDLRLPAGWVALQLFPDPFFTQPSIQGSSNVQSIVAPLANGKLHVLPEQAQFQRRIVLTPAGNESRALSILRSEGLGFNLDDYNIQGERLYSWWNPATPRYFPQNTRLPKIDWIPQGTLSGWLTTNVDKYASLLASGFSANNYPIYSTALGWAHPWGTPYGGMTGGTEIYPIDGVKTAFSGDLDGWRFIQVQHRMYTERQPIALFNKNGDPAVVEDWLKVHPIVHLPMNYFQVLSGQEELPGWSSAPSFQVDYVATNGLAPNYEAELKGYAPIDQQHYVRYSRSPKALVWLGNDPLAKDDLELSAELMRLSYTEYPTSASGYVAPSSMLSSQQFVANNPGIGFGFGRGPAWSLDVVNAAYATGRNAFRARVRPWTDAILDMVEDGQSSCTGIIQRISTNALLSGNYNVRQATEQTFIEQALMGLHEAVYESAFPAKANRLHAILEASVPSLFNGSSWSATQHAPIYTLAVDDLNVNGPGFCGNVPLGGFTAQVDKTHAFASLELGLRLIGGNFYVVRTAELIGATSQTADSALGVFEQTYFSSLENRAPIIAALQALLEP